MGVGGGVGSWSAYRLGLLLLALLHLVSSCLVVHKQKWERTSKPREERAGDCLGERGGHGGGAGAVVLAQRFWRRGAGRGQSHGRLRHSLGVVTRHLRDHELDNKQSVTSEWIAGFDGAH